jgi:anti-anti-sigma factor
MEIHEQQSGDVDIVSISGKLDAYSSADLEKTFNSLVAASRVKLVVNCDKLEYISSSGLRVLIAVLKKVRKVNGGVVLASVKPAILEVLSISGFTQLFTITENVSAAVESLSKS